MDYLHTLLSYVSSVRTHVKDQDIFFVDSSMKISDHYAVELEQAHKMLQCRIYKKLMDNRKKKPQNYL